MKISIITVTKNSEKFIADCINSVNYQNYKNIEHIIIDGASTDKTLSLIKDRIKKISSLVSEPDNSIYDAMNKGIKIASGEIIGFLNSDDLYLDNYVLSNVANIFKEDPSLDACYSDLIYTKRDDTSKVLRYWKSEKFSKGLFSKGWSPPHPTLFIRSSVYKKFGNFNVRYKIASDVELMMRFLEINKIKTMYIPEIWIKMRAGGVSNKNFTNRIKLNIEIIHALNKHKLSKNILFFFVNKFISRFKQLIYKKKFE